MMSKVGEKFIKCIEQIQLDLYKKDKTIQNFGSYVYIGTENIFLGCRGSLKIFSISKFY